MEFRSLRADEIECRVGQIFQNGGGLSLLLYKNSRTDGDILDETIGPENWQCSYDVINGQLFCTVSIWDDSKQQWICKQDVGSPSNVEAEKGRSSDALKRACFRWGIGKELYTAPRITIYANNRDGSENCAIKQGKNGKPQCYDEFSVERIEILDHQIKYVSIRNDSNGKIVFVWAAPENHAQTNMQANAPTREQEAEIRALVGKIAEARGATEDTVYQALIMANSLASAGVTDRIMTARQAQVAIGQLKAWIEKG